MMNVLRTTVLLGSLLFVPSVVFAQTDTGALTVTANVQSSIALTFENDLAGITLTGAATDTATMDFGDVSAYGTISTAGVTRTVGASSFTVSSPFGVKVRNANGSSASYTLQAALDSTDATNTWTINSTTLTTTGQALGATYGYDSAVSHTLNVTVPFSATGSSISKAVNFTATSN
jgi:hypothetical protein